jgi:hypothetical protein
MTLIVDRFGSQEFEWRVNSEPMDPSSVEIAAGMRVELPYPPDECPLSPHPIGELPAERAAEESAGLKNRLHTQAERKYRKAVNNELDRLRQAIPFQAKPSSKAKLTTIATERINSLQAEVQNSSKENECLREENERLREENQQLCEENQRLREAG